MPDDASQLRRRVIGWRTAERRERILRAEEGPMDPGSAWAAALELQELVPAGAGTVDATRVRDIEAARAAWRTIRMRLPRRH